MYVFGLSTAEIVFSNPASLWMFVVCVLCCQIEFSVSAWSFVHKSPTDCVASKVCDLQTSRIRGIGWRWAAAPQGEKIMLSMF